MDILYLHEKGSEDPWLSSKPNLVRKETRLGNTGIDHYAYNKLLEEEKHLQGQ
jgi:hypothetical protein